MHATIGIKYKILTDYATKGINYTEKMSMKLTPEQLFGFRHWWQRNRLTECWFSSSAVTPVVHYINILQL